MTNLDWRHLFIAFLIVILGIAFVAKRADMKDKALMKSDVHINYTSQEDQNFSWERWMPDDYYLSQDDAQREALSGELDRWWTFSWVWK